MHLNDGTHTQRRHYVTAVSVHKAVYTYKIEGGTNLS